MRFGQGSRLNTGMSRNYACIISFADRQELIAIADRFSYSIETLEDGILFDVSGLERLIGKPEKIAQNILNELRIAKIPGSVAIAGTVETATLLARQQSDAEHSQHFPGSFSQLPLEGLPIEEDTLNVFNDLGLQCVDDLLAIPEAELIDRYGHEFESIIRTIRQNGDRLLTPNVNENNVSWGYELDHPVEDFEQLIFILNHGLDTLFRRVAYYGLSTEHLDISFQLSNKTKRRYEIKTSFPTLERSFWLKLINLRVSLDPPEAGIVSLEVVSYFTKPRPSQRGLYAVSRPEPESLLLTVNKLKKLVGEENVGTPVLLDQRLERPFTLDSDALPVGVSNMSVNKGSIIGFSYYRPPLNAEVLVRDGLLVFVRTRCFSGFVTEYSGVWRSNSKWWERTWKSHEWDIEIESGGVYRLCRIENEWFVMGEYD